MTAQGPHPPGTHLQGELGTLISPSLAGTFSIIQSVLLLFWLQQGEQSLVFS